MSFDTDARELRLALASAGAVLDLSVDGKKATPVVLKEAQRDPVRGQTTHVDLLRVRLDEAIHAVVPLELAGVEEAPGVKEGGVLEQITRELNVEALPTAIPESIVHEVGEMEIGETIGLSAVSIPDGVTLLDDVEETVVATLSPPRLQTEVEEEIEAETEVVRRGRGAGRGRRGRGRRGLLRRGVAAPATPLRRRRQRHWRGRRLAYRRTGQPRSRARGNAPQRGLHGRRGAHRALGAGTGQGSLSRTDRRGTRARSAGC